MSDLKIDIRALLNKSGTKNDSGPISKSTDLASSEYREGELIVGTSQVDFDPGVTTPGQIIFVLLTAGAVVEFGPKISGPDIQDFGTLQDESPLGAGGLTSGAVWRLVSNTANTKIQYLVFSK